MPTKKIVSKKKSKSKVATSKGVKLTKTEIQSIDNMLKLAAKINDKGIDVDDPKLGLVTPAAALAIGVANLAIGLYNAFGGIVNPSDLNDAVKMRRAQKKYESLKALMANNDSNINSDIIKELRKELRVALK